MNDAGIARGPGMMVAALTAAIVFVIGWQLFPVKRRQAPMAPPPAVPVTPPVVQQAPPPPTAVDSGAAAAAATDASAAASTTADAATKSAVAPDGGKQAAPEKASVEPEETKPATEEAAQADHKPTVVDKQKQADKDLAREAWRRNRPDVSVSGNKTSILVPIRGSTRGADFKIVNKRRAVVVTLPKAVSMITMKVYTLKHPSFKKVWIDQDEANAQPDDGTKLRFILGQTLDPQVEITEDFVRVTIRRPEPSGDAEEARPAKHGERSEKRAEPADEAPAAPAPEKPAE